MPTQKERDQLIKDKAFEKLGGACSACGKTDRRVLQVDHVNNDGADERRKGGQGPRDRYTRVLNDSGGRYQLLCANCRWIKTAENPRPKKERDGLSPNNTTINTAWAKRKATKLLAEGKSLEYISTAVSRSLWTIVRWFEEEDMKAAVKGLRERAEAVELLGKSSVRGQGRPPKLEPEEGVTNPFRSLSPKELEELADD